MRGHGFAFFLALMMQNRSPKKDIVALSEGPYRQQKKDVLLVVMFL